MWRKNRMSSRKKGGKQQKKKKKKKMKKRGRWSQLNEASQHDGHPSHN